MQRSLKLPQVQHSNKTIQKVQQITEVSQQQHMNVDVPAEIQCQNTVTHQNNTDAKTGAGDPEDAKCTEGPEHADVRFLRSSSAIARSSISDLEPTTDEFVQSPVQCCRSRADEIEMREKEEA